MADQNYAYCGNCQDIMPVLVEPMENESVDGAYLGGDVICTSCYGVLATMYKPKDKVD